MKLTGWYSGDQKPVRVGVYQQTNGNFRLGYQYWDGKLWRSWCKTPEDAYRVREGLPAAPVYQNDQWRGIAK